MLEQERKRFEQEAPVGVMGRMTLEYAFDSSWVDEIFEAERQRQYSRELLFSTVVDLVTLVSLGLRPSLHAAAKQAKDFPVSLAALYDKVKRTEPAVLRGLVTGSAKRLIPVMEPLNRPATLPGWQIRIVDGNHLAPSEKRLKPLRTRRGAALPGHALVVYDPDTELVCDMVGCEDAYTSERAAVPPLLDRAQAGQLWIADRHFCTEAILNSLHTAQSHFLVREHSTHPRLLEQGPWQECGRVETGTVYEQSIRIAGSSDTWRCIEIRLDTPTDDGDMVIRLWCNLPRQVSAQTIANLYRTRWRIEAMFQRLESVLQSELTTLGHPRAALLGFAVSLLAYNLLALLKGFVELAHRPQLPEFEASPYHLALQLKSSYEGMLIALPREEWTNWSTDDPDILAQQLLLVAQNVRPKSVATAKRGPKIKKKQEYVENLKASAHFSTHRVLNGDPKRP
jgi:IS4 transposase